MLGEVDKAIEAAPGIFRIPVPLPKNPLKELNAYFIRGISGGRNLLIDTGFNKPECESALRNALEHIGADMSVTDIFITHMHSDHSGLMNKIADENSRVFISRADGDIVNRSVDIDYWNDLDDLFTSYGYPRRKRRSIEKHPGWEWGVRQKVRFNSVEEGDVFEVGKYVLRTVWTPGHTPGHMCLYDERFGVLFTADHVLAKITPNVTIERYMDDPLRLYLGSLDKVRELKADIILPGHRTPPTSLIHRVDELKMHHAERLEEILNILSGSPATAYEVAQKMTWDIAYDSWEAFPPNQKWFATGEAISHLQYLWTEGRIRKYESSGVYYYQI